MKKLLRLTFLLSFAFVFSFVSHTASAQPWSANAGSFTGTIHIVKFLDAQGNGQIGFVADDTGMSRTTDGGTTWTRCTINSPNNPPPAPAMHTGWVNDITFEPDGLHGYAITDSVTGSPIPDAGVLITSDGGVTWTFIDNPGTPDSGDGIYYSPASDRLFVASDDRGLLYSTNRGQTWAVCDGGKDTGKFYTGFAFTDDLHGIVATEGSTCSPLVTHYWLYTDDGGVSWHQSRMFIESWQPAGIPTTLRFFGASTNYCFTQNEEVIEKSDDGGYGFGPISGYSGTLDTLNESMQADGCLQFAASAAANVGMVYSKNDGVQWVPMTGAPNPPIDTRFYLSPSKVWSFHGNTLYSSPRPATADIHYWPDTILMRGASCGNITDTVVHVFGCNCNRNLAVVRDSVGHLSNNFVEDTITPKIPPTIQLCNGNSNVARQFTISYEPGAPSPDSADFHLFFQDTTALVDRFVHFVGNGAVPDLVLEGSPTININTPACVPVDTCIMFVNPSCSPITIINTDPSPPDYGPTSNAPCFIQLLGWYQLQQLPDGITLLPGQEYCFPIHYEPGLKKAFFSAGFKLLWKDASGVVHDTKQRITINANTTTTLRPTFQGFTATGDCCAIDTQRHYAFIFNTTCDTITLLKPVVISPTHSSCVSQFKLVDNHHYPIVVPPGYHDFDTVLIDCQNKGGCDALVVYEYSISANLDTAFGYSALCTSTQFDTISVPISFVSSQAPLVTTITPSPQVNFGNVGCCDSNETETVTITAGCQPDTITGVTISAAGGSGGYFFVVPPGPSFPVPLRPERSMSFQVGFSPRCDNGGGPKDAATLSVQKKTSGSLSTQLTANVTNLAGAVLSGSSLVGDTLDLGSLLPCHSICGTADLRNSSCGQIKLIVLTGPTLACFTSPAIDSATLMIGDSTQFHVCLTPANCNKTGDILDSAIFQISDISGGGSTFNTLYLKGHIETPTPGYVVTNLSPATICDSSSIDETFTLTDTGACYKLNVIGVNTGNAQVTVTPTTATLDSGQQQTFSVHFAAVDTGTFTGPIQVLTLDGTTITVPYNFRDTSCNKGVDTVIVSLSSDTVTVPNCTSGPIEVTVKSNLNSPGTVNSLAVTGSGRFSVTGPASGSFPYTGTITFDPNQPGGNTAMATVNYTFNNVSGQKSFDVYGIISGVKDSVRLGLVALTNSCVKPNDTDIDSMEIVVRDPIPANTGFDTLSFDVSYDGNLTWGAKGILDAGLPAGWSIVSITNTKYGVHVVLAYTGTSGLPANSPLLKLNQLAAIGDSLSTTATIRNVHFNDSAFEACTMKALSFAGDMASICVDTNICGGGPLYYANHGDLGGIHFVVVVPNPIHKNGSAGTLHFTTDMDGTVTAEILDQLGRSQTMLTNGPMPAGDHDLSIPTDRMGEGIYFARITVNGVTVIRQFVLDKE